MKWRQGYRAQTAAAGIQARKINGFAARFALLLAGTLGASLLGFIIQLVLARILPIDDYGHFSATMAAINLATPIATFGIPWFWLQTFGREGWRGFRWFLPSIRLIAATTLGTFAVFSCYALYGGSMQPAERIPVLFLGLTILLGQCATEIAMARLQLEERYGAMAAWQTSGQAGRLGAALMVWTISALSLIPVMVGYAAVGCGLAVATGKMLFGMWRGNVELVGHQKPTPPATNAFGPGIWQTARLSLPFALMTISYLMAFQSVLILLDWIVGPQATAVYQAALLLISAIYMIPQVIYTKFLLGRICRWVEHDKEMFVASFHLGVIGMAIAGMSFMAVVAIMAPYFLPLIYGNRYAGAVPVLIILSLCIPVHFVQQVYSSLFITSRDIVRKVKYAAISAFVCIMCNLVLLQYLGPVGAAVSALAAEVTALVLIVVASERYIDGINVKDTFRRQTLQVALAVVGWPDRSNARNILPKPMAGFRNDQYGSGR